jgi:hypothetical protein
MDFVLFHSLAGCDLMVCGSTWGYAANWATVEWLLFRKLKVFSQIVRYGI